MYTLYNLSTLIIMRYENEMNRILTYVDKESIDLKRA